VPGNEDAYTAFYSEAEKLKKDWFPFKQGMFCGDYTQYQEVVKQAEEYYKRVIGW